MIRKFQLKIHWRGGFCSYGIINIYSGICSQTTKNSVSKAELNSGWISVLNKVQVDKLIAYFNDLWIGPKYSHISKYEIVKHEEIPGKDSLV